MTPLLLLATALTLGLRHGIDWDHIAALVDISGANSDEQARDKALILCFCYALGHGFIVFLLGLAAISFAAILPTWIDSVMERVVGLTLLLLGIYLFYSVYKLSTSKGEFKLQSRLMLLHSLLGQLFGKLWPGLQINKRLDMPARHFAAGGAFSIGVLHGLGAETGTQILLVTAVGRAGTCDISLAMLAAFIVGLLISNSIVACLATRGFKTSLHHKPLFMLAGTTAGAFSLWLGFVFAIGRSGALPSLQTL